MAIISTVLILFWLVIIPIVLGYGFISVFQRNDEQKNKKLCLAFVVGFLIECVLYQIFSVPFTYFSGTFKGLTYTWGASALILAGVSAFLIKKDIKNIWDYNVKEIKDLPKILATVIGIITIWQCYQGLTKASYNYDDYNMLAIGNISRQTNTLFKYDCSGNEVDIFDGIDDGMGRYFLSQFPNFTASLAELCNVHTLVMAHSAFQVWIILLAYSTFYLLSTSIFKSNENSLIFMLILILSYMFSGYSEHSYQYRLLMRGWQGKSFVANIVFPFIFYIFNEYIGDEKDLVYWVLIGIAMWGGTMMSNVGMVISPIIVAMLTVIYFIKYREWSIPVRALISVIPTVVYALTYILLF